jgi:hypothetical protein
MRKDLKDGAEYYNTGLNRRIGKMDEHKGKMRAECMVVQTLKDAHISRLMLMLVEDAFLPATALEEVGSSAVVTAKSG